MGSSHHVGRRPPVHVDRAAVVPAVLARMAALPPAARTRTRWIGIDGRGASGKSTLAREIVDALPAAILVSVDDFARPDVRGWEIDRFIAQVRDPLLAGRAGCYQRWDFHADQGVEWCDVPAGVPLVVEGVSATDVRAGVPWDVTVWVEAPGDVRLRRALERDGPAMAQRWLTDWIPSEEQYVAAQHPQDRADLVVSTAD